MPTNDDPRVRMNRIPDSTKSRQFNQQDWDKSVPEFDPKTVRLNAETIGQLIFVHSSRAGRRSDQDGI